MNDDQVKKERCSDCGSWPSERHRTYCRKQYEQVRADVAFRAARDEVDNGMRELLLPYRSGPAEGIGVTLKRVLADYERLKAAERVTDPLRYLAPRLRPIADDNRVRRRHEGPWHNAAVDGVHLADGSCCAPTPCAGQPSPRERGPRDPVLAAASADGGSIYFPGRIRR